MGISGPTGNSELHGDKQEDSGRIWSLWYLLELSSGIAHTTWLPCLFLDFPVKDVTSSKVKVNPTNEEGGLTLSQRAVEERIWVTCLYVHS